MVTVRTVISLETSKNWHLFQMDVNYAFLHGDLYEEVDTHLPQDFHTKEESKVYELSKSLYDLRQASRQ